MLFKQKVLPNAVVGVGINSSSNDEMDQVDGQDKSLSCDDIHQAF